MSLDIVMRKRQNKDHFEQMGVFISHSSKDESFERITNLLTENNIEYLSDKLIKPGNDNYIKYIKSLLKNASGGVALVSKESMESPWVVYELGMLEGMGKQIVLYCDNNIDESKKYIPNNLKKYPLITDNETLIKHISNYTVFENLFEYETATVSLEDFKRGTINNVNNIILSYDISSNLQKLNVEMLEFGYIIVRLAKYGYVNDNLDNCLASGEIREDGKCFYYKDNSINCSFLEEIHSKDSPETIILNKTLYHSRVNQGLLDLAIPFHRKYGVTFKCFIDVKDISIKHTVVNELRKLGMKDVSFSGAALENRIYYLLPEKKEIGLFNLISHGSGIVNNYICPGCYLE